MNQKIIFFLALLISSCVYDAPKKGIVISIHNQTDGPLLITDSLGGHLKMYDTAKINNRIFIDRPGNYMAAYATYDKFYSGTIIDSFERKNQDYIRLYLLGENHFPNDTSNFVFGNPYRSFDINIGTIKKYKLNHLFIYKDTILFEHNFDYTIRK